ncbi:hypothetical protein MKW94_009374 [Papaver nudicaule]|uniref:Enhancer of polycomb-like protein n=1 Tax=Papaver nudicaule TaxID=74823 RepID=A0AA42B5F5_PAPNU|nr:hypothetical protein [Papaver nudicaule]
MENIVKTSDVSEISKEPKLFDGESLNVEVLKEHKDLKRKRSRLSERVESKEVSSGEVKKKKKKKNRKEIPGVGLELDSKEGQNAVCVLKVNGVSEQETQVSEGSNLKNTNNSSNDISLKLNHNAIAIPKRPRGSARRKKSNNNGISVSAQTPGNVASDDAQVAKLDIKPTVPIITYESRSKKLVVDTKENGSNGGNSSRHVKTENGASVGHVNDSIEKKVHRRKRKVRDSETQSVKSVKHLDAAPDKSPQTSANLQDDDEDNLEQNAARMLSSLRFDPSCTGFSGNRSASTSMNGCSITPPVSRVGLAAHSAGSEANSADAAVRVLRPRKQYKEKGQSRRRRHFYELFCRDLDAYWVLNRRIQVFWPLDKSWYIGLVNDYDPEKSLHHVKYDDREEEWINLHNEKFKLLLLPSEVPRKAGSKNSKVRGKHVDDRHVDSEEEGSGVDSFVESEPIISWLSRLTSRVKSSSVGGIKKRRKTLSASMNHVSRAVSDDSIATPSGCLGAGPSRNHANQLSGAAGLERSSDGEKSMIDHTARSRNLPLVYVRRRFHGKGKGLGCASNETSRCRNDAVSDSSLASFADIDTIDLLKEYDSTHLWSGLDRDIVYWTGENLRLLRFRVLKLRTSLQCASGAMFGGKEVCMSQFLMLLHHGVLITLWPRVRLEMLFVDNVVGLRFMLFEGCMLQAVSLICLVMAIFRQPNRYKKFVDPQLPITSIRLKLSSFPGLMRHLAFVSYNFMELDNSKWQYLDDKLKQYCLVTKQLPLSECTFDNVRVMQNGSNQLPVSSGSGMPFSVEGLHRKPTRGIMHMGFSKEFAHASNHTGFLLSNSDGKHRRFPPFVLSFTAAPSFFVSLHLKLLMEKSVASVSFQNFHSMAVVEDSESHEILMAADDSSSIDQLADQENPKVEIDALSISNGGYGMWLPENCLLDEHNVTETNVGPQDSGKNENSDDRSSLEKSESGHLSHLSSISVQIPSDNQFGTQSLDRGRLNAQQSKSNLVWHMNDCNIRSPNPTAPRSSWQRSRQNSGSLSFSHRSNLCTDGMTDPTHNGIANGSRKPRSQISYVVPFGGHDFSSKPRSHLRRGRPHKKMRDENEKMISGGSRSPQRQPDYFSCDANVLITENDRGRRECGSRVVLEFVDDKDWQLLVKLAGVMKYSHKPYQILQAGSTNRHTHAMMWKGGKDWTLEFPDRSQWARFKEMHEECYNRNNRAALVKSIPIPGVRLLEESEIVAAAEPFVRTSKYYRQLESDAEMALNPSRYMYDMDTDDEEWLSRYQSSLDVGGNSRSEISVDLFERTMDIFERVAFADKRIDFTLDEIDEIIADIGPFDAIEIIFNHWQLKRRRRRWPLLRQLQPPLYERYQRQLTEWERDNFSNGCNMKGIQEKPAMFAFCLRPRGLERANKFSKQKSHRKLSAGGNNYIYPRDPKDQDELQIIGRRYNGYEERGVLFGQNYDYSDASSWLQTSTRTMSPRDAVVSGYLSMSSDGSERSHHQTIHPNKSQRMRTFSSPRDSHMMTMSYNQRTSKRNGMSQWNMGLSEWPNNRRQYYNQSNGFQRVKVEQLDDSDVDEFRLRDASGAAKHASNMAKLKREKAQRLLYRADLAIHKASAALMIAEAMKASSEKELTDDDE